MPHYENGEMQILYKGDPSPDDPIQRWFLAYIPAQIEDDSIGIGSCPTYQYFLSEGAREQFIAMQPRIDRLRQKVSDLQCELRDLKTVRGANRNLKEVRAARLALFPELRRGLWKGSEKESL